MFHMEIPSHRDKSDKCPCITLIGRLFSVDILFPNIQSNWSTTICPIENLLKMGKPRVKLAQEPLTTGRHPIGKYTKGQMFVRQRRHFLEKLQKGGKLKNPKKVEKQKKTIPQKVYKFKTKKGAEAVLKVNPKVVPPPTERPRKRVVNTRNTTKPTRLRKSLTPGTVLILLSGRFAGKRVVFLKQLKSGLLLVTGPFKLNGVPLRRVNQRYVIATSTKVDVSKVDSSKVVDETFVKVVAKKTGKPEPKAENPLFKKEEKPKAVVPEEFKKLQISVDEAILKAVAGVEHLDGYLKTMFSLNKGQYPHEIKF